MAQLEMAGAEQAPYVLVAHPRDITFPAGMVLHFTFADVTVRHDPMVPYGVWYLMTEEAYEQAVRSIQYG